ncbi:choline sulfate utilization transcriptional regulator [Methylobrevis pamukkalensis]|uniref:Glycine cleavage system transcriptional activator n=1 Tax=Methylobrevis pamukkalensis TaxID=1439726 RepID=A0A1E3H6E9_9HYPH|nr:LysR substrate-binding domain-containing protein [Methylobrevis pamukkalensis]ODN71909.1 Glycine cleavage system transcriptional activator [Methylobrevis pamukkalensis]
MARDRLDVGWLRVFEAVGRTRNLTRAAGELGLSQPAVSYQIRRIEDELGVPLVRRLHRGTDLTADGEALHEAVSAGLARIDEAARRIRRRRRPAAVRLFTDYGFAAFWLMPRIAEFRRLRPQIEVHIVASQALEADDEAAADIHVLFGARGQVPDGAVLIMPERVVPVCSPGFLARFGPFGTPESFAGVKLLHLDSGPAPRWYTWTTWLGAHHVTREPSSGDLGLNTYSLVVQAALAEQGVALGWVGLVDDLLDSGALVRVGPELVREDRGYWLVADAPRGSDAGTLAAWLLEVCG